MREIRIARQREEIFYSLKPAEPTRLASLRELNWLKTESESILEICNRTDSRNAAALVSRHQNPDVKLSESSLLSAEPKSHCSLKPLGAAQLVAGVRRIAL